jgi:hypothetical protein
MPFSMVLLEKIEKNDPAIKKVELRVFPLLTDKDITVLVETVKEGQNTSLKNVSLSETKITDEGAKKISALSQLTEVSLTTSEIGDSGAIALASASNIKYLNLSGNKIGDTGARVLAQNNTLGSLSLIGNKISDVGAKEFLKNNTLTKLFLEENSISPDLLKELGIHIQENANRIKEKKSETSSNSLSSTILLMQKTDTSPILSFQKDKDYFLKKKHKLEGDNYQVTDSLEKKVKSTVKLEPTIQGTLFKNKDHSKADSIAGEKLTYETEKLLKAVFAILDQNPTQWELAEKLIQEHRQLNLRKTMT